MNYIKNVLIEKNSDDVLQAARDYFLHQNFKIISANTNSISAENNLI